MSTKLCPQLLFGEMGNAHFHSLKADFFYLHICIILWTQVHFFMSTRCPHVVHKLLIYFERILLTNSNFPISSIESRVSLWLKNAKRKLCYLFNENRANTDLEKMKILITKKPYKNMAFFLFVLSDMRTIEEKKMKKYLIKKFIHFIVEILVEFLIATFLGLPFDLTRTLQLFMLCEIININYDFELLLQYLIPNRLLKCIIVDLISTTVAVLILDGYISDPVSYFITVTVISSVLKYFLKNKLNEGVVYYSLF